MTKRLRDKHTVPEVDPAMLLHEILNTAVLDAIRKRYYEQQHLSIRRQFDSADCQFIRSIAPPSPIQSPHSPHAVQLP